MKTIGLLGDMSWESLAAIYYRLINQLTRLRSGSHPTATPFDISGRLRRVPGPSGNSEVAA